MAKTIITCALTGAVTPKDKNPAVPITPKEIADDAIKVWKAGASIVHIHMRDENGNGTMDHVRFKETFDRIRDNTDLVINLTTSGDLEATEEERMAHIIECKPEMASFDITTVNLEPDGLFENNIPFLTKLSKVMLENHVKPEVEIFDLGAIDAINYFRNLGLLESPTHVQFVLGTFSSAQSTTETLVFLKNQLPPDCTWSALGIGKGHLPIMYAALSMGGHIRVGLEDNMYYARGQMATNEMLVARAARVIREMNDEPATPDEAREILGLVKR